MTVYKQAHQIFEKWENDKPYELGLKHRSSGQYQMYKVFAKDINEARRLSDFWLSDSGNRKEGWVVQYVLPFRQSSSSSQS